MIDSTQCTAIADPAEKWLQSLVHTFAAYRCIRLSSQSDQVACRPHMLGGCNLVKTTRIRLLPVIEFLRACCTLQCVIPPLTYAKGRLRRRLNLRHANSKTSMIDFVGHRTHLHAKPRADTSSTTPCQTSWPLWIATCYLSAHCSCTCKIPPTSRRIKKYVLKWRHTVLDI